MTFRAVCFERQLRRKERQQARMRKRAKQSTRPTTQLNQIDLNNMNIKPISQRGARQRVLLGACLLLLCVLDAQAWRAFDPLDGVRHFSTDYFQPPPSPFMTNFYTNNQPINLAQLDSRQQQQQQQQQAQASQTQILTPASTQVHQFEASPQPQLNNFQEQAPPSNSNHQQSVQEAQQEFTKHDLGHEQPHQLEVRHAPPPTPITSTRAPASFQPSESAAPSAAPLASDSVIGRDISQVTPSEAPRKFQQPESIANDFQHQKPSPFGKILDSLYQSPASTVNVTSGSDKQMDRSPADVTTGKPALQMLKPRRSGEARKPTPAAIEQQIIDQHARAAAGYNSHSSQYSSPPTTSTTPQPQQRLLPVTKNRGDSANPNRLGAMLLNSLGVLAGSSSGASSSSSFHDEPTSSSSQHHHQLHASPIARIMDNFKSGISSRSSIMKAAISDNKLARTLTNVGKTLGGNKYVASAGIAAALAALGLTVGKYLSPYSLSSGAQYSKISADPLLPSGSLVFGNYAPNERHLSQWAADSNPFTELTATSSNNMPSTYELPSSSNYGQFDTQPNIDQAALHQMAAAVGLYPGSQHAYNGPESLGQNFVSQQSQISNQLWSPPMNYQVIRPVISQRPASREPKPFGTANGHYSNFYSQPEIEAATGDTSDQSAANSMSMQTQQPQPPMSLQQQPAQQYGTYISGAPASTSYQDQTGYSSESRQQAGVGDQSQASFDQIPSASLETATYQKAPAIQQQAGFSAKRRAGSTGRRSGAVILKLDEATRSRLEQLSANQRNNNQAAESRPYANYFVLNTPSDQQQRQSSSGLAQQATLSRSTRAHQAQLFAPPPQPLDTMTNRQQWSPARAGQQQQQQQASSPNKSTRLDGASGLATLQQAAEEGQLSASGGQLLDSITSPSAKRTQESKWRQASQNNENARPTAVAVTKQSAPEYQFIRPASSEQQQHQPAVDQIVFGFTNEHAKVSPARAQPHSRSQTMLDGGWKSLDDLGSAGAGVEMARNQSPDETGRSEYARGHDDSASSSGQLHRVSRTPSRSSGHSKSEDGDGKLTSDQFQQMVTLINQQRALEQSAANEVPTATLRDIPGQQYLFATPSVVGSIENKSDELGGKWNEVVNPQATSTVTKTTAAPQQDNHDKTPKSIGSPIVSGTPQPLANVESVDTNETPIDADNKQSAASSSIATTTATTTRQVVNNDDVVLELVDAGELLGAESNASAAVVATKQKAPAPAATKGEGETASSRQQADAAQSSDNNANSDEGDDEDQQLGKPRAYRGLVAGSIAANATN